MNANGARGRRFTRRAALLAVGCVAGGLLGGGCTSSGATASNPIVSQAAGSSAHGAGGCKVGFALDDYGPERYQWWDGPPLEQVLDREGATYELTDARGSAESQAAAIDAFVAAGTDVIIVQPVTYETDGVPAAVKRATDAGIAVIAYDTLIESPDLVFLGFDWAEAGRMEARATLAARPTGSYVIIKGNETFVEADTMRLGIGEVLRPSLDSGAIEIVAETYTENWDPYQAELEMDAILKTNANKVDAVIVESDGMASGVIKSLTDAGLAGKVAVSAIGGFGGFPMVANFNAIARGTQIVEVWQDYRQLGKAAAEIAVQLCRDRDIAKLSGTTRVTTPGGISLAAILLPSISIARDNLGVILDTGWIKKDELCEGVDPATAPAACG